MCCRPSPTTTPSASSNSERAGIFDAARIFCTLYIIFVTRHRYFPPVPGGFCVRKASVERTRYLKNRAVHLSLPYRFLSAKVYTPPVGTAGLIRTKKSPLKRSKNRSVSGGLTFQHSYPQISAVTSSGYTVFKRNYKHAAHQMLLHKVSLRIWFQQKYVHLSHTEWASDR